MRLQERCRGRGLIHDRAADNLTELTWHAEVVSRKKAEAPKDLR